MVKLRLERCSQRLLVPIYLAPSPTPFLLALAAGTPAVVFAAARRLLLRPRKTRKKARMRAILEAEEEVRVIILGVTRIYR